jgi:uncharacterized damage-inducible protein DinB
MLHELFEYNYWSQDRQFEACSPLTQEQFSRPLGGSFSSLRDTLAHLVDGEQYALHRWHGHSRQEIINAMGFSKVSERLTLWPNQFPTLAALRSAAQAVEVEVWGFLEGLTEAQMGRSISYIDGANRPWVYPLWRMLFHHVTHQTYHRGQVTTLLRQLGVQPAKIDFLEAYDHGVGQSPGKIG